jgi:hypothetical protein
MICSPFATNSICRSISNSSARCTERSEFMFFTSVFVPSSVAPRGRIDTFASQRSDPSSMRTSEEPSVRSSVRSSATYARASSGDEMSASDTISTNGMPARL